MALDPNIPLAVQPFRTQDIPNPLLAAGQVNQLQLQQAELAQAPIAQQLMQERVNQLTQANQYNQQISPLLQRAQEIANAQNQEAARQQQLQSAQAEQQFRQNNAYTMARDVKPLLDAGDISGAKKILRRNMDELARAGVSIEDPQELHAMLDQNQFEQARQAVNSVLEQFAPAEKPLKVQSADILPDGTTIQVMSDGMTRVTGPEGKELTGKARSDAIRSAQEFGVDIQQRRAQGRKIGEFSAKTAEQVFTRADQMRQNNDNLRQIIEEVKNGASSGPLINKLPSLKAATIRLNNLKNRLGLDVIGSTTFGALSEGELKLAMATAVPDLTGQALAEWAENKIIAQEKLLGYLEEQAAFLSEPGNTPSDWLQQVKSRKPKEGGEGMSDDEYEARKRALGL